MSKGTVEYRQCRLIKKCDASCIEQVSWIPAKFAVEGRYLRLRSNDAWDDGWRVASVWGRSFDANERSRDYRKQRSVSDRPRSRDRKRIEL